MIATKHIDNKGDDVHVLSCFTGEGDRKPCASYIESWQVLGVPFNKKRKKEIYKGWVKYLQGNYIEYEEMNAYGRKAYP